MVKCPTSWVIRSSRAREVVKVTSIENEETIEVKVDAEIPVDVKDLKEGKCFKSRIFKILDTNASICVRKNSQSNNFSVSLSLHNNGVYENMPTKFISMISAKKTTHIFKEYKHSNLLFKQGNFTFFSAT